MIYKESMTSNFFVEWFKTQLLPVLKSPHVIVMDNASFHPKNILDELCIQDKNFSYLYHLIHQIWILLSKLEVSWKRKWRIYQGKFQIFLNVWNAFLKLNDYRMNYWNSKKRKPKWFSLNFKNKKDTHRYLYNESGRQDSNLRHLGPKPSTLPSWATSRVKYKNAP